MACGGMGGCGGGNNSFNRSSNHAPKKMPNFGMKPSSGGKKNFSGGHNSFGTPKVRMSFGSRRKGY